MSIRETRLSRGPRPDEPDADADGRFVRKLRFSGQVILAANPVRLPRGTRRVRIVYFDPSRGVDTDPKKLALFTKLVSKIDADAWPLLRVFHRVNKLEVPREQRAAALLEWMADATGKRLSKTIGSLLLASTARVRQRRVASALKTIGQLICGAPVKLEREREADAPTVLEKYRTGAISQKEATWRLNPPIFPEEDDDLARRAAQAESLYGGRISGAASGAAHRLKRALVGVRDANATGHRFKRALVELRDAMDAARPFAVKFDAGDRIGRAIIAEVHGLTMIVAFDRSTGAKVLLPGNAKVPKGLFTLDAKPKPQIAKMPKPAAFVLAERYTGMDTLDTPAKTRRGRWDQALKRWRRGKRCVREARTTPA